MIAEVHLACRECEAAIVLLDVSAASLDFIEYPLCKTCIERPREGCEDLNTEQAPMSGPKEIA